MNEKTFETRYAMELAMDKIGRAVKAYEGGGKAYVETAFHEILDAIDVIGPLLYPDDEVPVQ